MHRRSLDPHADPRRSDPRSADQRGSHLRRLGGWRLPIVLALFGIALTLMPQPLAAEEPTVVAYDAAAAHGGPASVRLSGQFTGTAAQLFVALLDDCEPGQSSPNCGNPPVRWADGDQPVPFCTFQDSRPPQLTAQEFRDRVSAMTAYWSSLNLAVGVEYSGDCPTGFRWEPDNRRNEIGFDDGRNVVNGSAAGLTLSTWNISFLGSQVTSKDLLETDVILEPSIGSEPLACFNSVLLHEIGHALGFAHSDTAGDLMFPSFVSGDLSTCPNQISASERARLSGLYGQNAAPTVSAGSNLNVAAGAAVQLTGVGADANNDVLTYSWKQLSGTTVSLQQSQATANFTAPTQQGAVLTFEVTAKDKYLHSARATVTVTVGSAPSQSAGPLQFDTFLTDAVGARAELGWIGGGGAPTFEICRGSTPGSANGGCTTTATSTLAMTWDRVLGAAGATGSTVTEGGYQYTKIRACTGQQCSAFVDGPVAGGLRWAARKIDYDYFAMAFDIGTIQFTIAGVINLSSTSRPFLLHNGPASDPARRLIGSCSRVQSGGLCIDFFGVGDGRQYEIVQISSPGGSNGVTTRHRIPVR